jgi:hypothetical protein
MRSVRCDACGAKAMTAAAKCPKCSHLLDLRNGFGQLLPLAYCSSCDSYYPEHLGECKWCHTKPEKPPIGPKVWRGIGAGLAAVLGGLWLIGNLTSSDTKRPRTKTNAPTVARNAAADSSVADTTSKLAPTSVVASASEDSIAPPTNVAPSAPIVLPQAVAPPMEPAGEPVARQAATVKPGKTTSSNGTIASPSRRVSSRWVRSVSRDWVVIRGGASKRSKIVASIGPNSRVELGESRGTWRRVRAKGVAGWVEPRNLFDVARSR